MFFYYFSNHFLYKILQNFLESEEKVTVIETS